MAHASLRSSDAPRAAHRPSRRQEITDAAVRVFARLGFADASVLAVAEEAKVAPTAVYYHFASKEDLFDEAVRQVLASCDAIIELVRPTDVPGDPHSLGLVLAAVWQWTVDNPEQAALLSGPLTATPQSRLLRDEWEQRHVSRGFDYLAPRGGDSPGSSTEELRRDLAIRTLIRLSISVHILRLEGGPLHRHSPHALSRAVRDVAGRLVES